jgi:hypothetical protein
MTNAQWANTIALIEFEEVAREEAMTKIWDWEKIYGDTKKTKEHEMKGYVWTAFGLPSERSYGEDIRTETMQEVGSWTLYDTEIALGADIDDKLLEDMRHITQKSFLNQMGTGFGESYAQAKSIYANMPFERAFSNSVQAMWDTGALCGTRTLLDGTTWTNALGAGSVSWSRIWDMIDVMKLDQRTQKGLKQRGIPRKLMVHEAQERDVPRMLNQEYEFDGTIATGGTTDYVSSKNTNSLRSKNLQIVYNQELSNENDMFLFGKRAARNFKFRMRKNMKTAWQFDGGKRNRTRSAFTHMRFTVGVTHFIDVVGAPGT